VQSVQIQFWQHSLRTNGIYDKPSGTRGCDPFSAVESIDRSNISAFVQNLQLVDPKRPSNEPLIHTTQLTKHSLFVAKFMSKYATLDPSLNLGAGEAFGIGVMHEFGTCIFEAASEGSVRYISSFAAQCGVPFDVAFMNFYPRSIYELTASTCDIWQLSKPLQSALIGLGSDTVAQQQISTMTPGVLLTIADFAANKLGLGWEIWKTTTGLNQQTAQIYKQNYAVIEQVLCEVCPTFGISESERMCLAA
jgi:hypothetical protein